MEALTLRGVELVDKVALFYGASTEIYGGIYRGECVSIKRYRQFNSSDDLKTSGTKINLRDFTQEVQIMIRVQSPHVLHFIGVCSDLFPIPCLVSPWMSNGTIGKYVKAKGPANINLEKRITELASAIEYVHSKGVVHNAISESTVFIKADGTSCLGGFGLATLDEEDYDLEPGVGRYAVSIYIAPELLDTRRAAASPADIYSFACLTYRLYTGKSPRRFISIIPKSGEVQTLQTTRPLLYEDPGLTISDDIWDMLRSCLNKSPARRASAKDVKKFMDDLNQHWNTGAWKVIENTLARWMFDKSAKRLCWLENSDSTNTTYISRSMAELCAREGRLAASLFFVSGSGLTRFDLFSNFAVQLMHNIPTAQRFISKVITETPAILKPGSREMLQNLLSRIILQPLAILKSSMVSPKVIVIDSLNIWEKVFESDEASKWLTANVFAEVMLWLSDSLRQHGLPLRIFLASSPEFLRNAQESDSEFQNICLHLNLHLGRLVNSDSINVWQELRRLSASDAGYDADSEYHTISHTVDDDIFVKIDEWYKGHERQRICWLKYPSLVYGQRSSAAMFAARQWLDRKALAACIFCSSTIDAASFLPTLALQLAKNIVSLKAEMKRIIENNKELLCETESERFAQAVIVEALWKVKLLPPMIIVIDCTGWLGGQSLLTQLVWLDQALRDHHIPFRFLIISEPELFSNANMQFPTFIDSALVLQLLSIDSWDSSPSSARATETDVVYEAQSIFGEISQVIYQNLSRFLCLKISSYYRDDKTLCDEFEKCLDHISRLDRVHSLIESDQYRTKLLQFSNAIGFSGHIDVRNALEKDDVLLAGLLKEVLESRSEKELILSLKDESAYKCLDMLQLVLSKGLLSEFPECSRKARRLFIRLSQNAEIILHSQLISGLTLLNNGQAVNGGGYADIFRAVYQGREVAIKRIRNHLGKDSLKIRRAFAQEALVWQYLKHPNVLPFLGIDSEMFTSSLCMVSPWMKNGTIMEFRAVVGPSNIVIDQRLIEIIDGLRYLHEEGIVHGDLRGGNILVDDEWHAVLADFGLTVFGDSTMTATTHETNPRGTTRWMAPELLDPEIDDLNGLKKTEASDVYAFGCVCLELYTGRPPFADTMNEAAVICQLVQGKQSPIGTLSENNFEREALPIPEDINTLIKKCWIRAPKERPCSADIMKILKERSTTC